MFWARFEVYLYPKKPNVAVAIITPSLPREVVLRCFARGSLGAGLGSRVAMMNLLAYFGNSSNSSNSKNSKNSKNSSNSSIVV